jgi:hypothetical protein
MRRSSGIMLLALASLALLTAACAPPRIAVGADAVTTTVVLPTEERCLYAVDGATLTLDGERLSWTCESPADAPRGLMSAPIVTAGVDVAWRLVATERAVTEGGYVIAQDELVQGRAEQLTLATDETCTIADPGSGLTFDQGPVTYTCGLDVVIVGDLRADPRGLIAVRGVLVRPEDLTQATRLGDPRTHRVTSVTLR